MVRHSIIRQCKDSCVTLKGFVFLFEMKIMTVLVLVHLDFLE